MENKKCPVCGKELKITIDESSILYECINCGHKEITTYAEGIKWDSTLYKIILKNKQKINNSNIVLISSITGFNYIKSKEILNNGGDIVKDTAVKVAKICSQLNKNNLQYEINPKFQYEIK